MALPLSVRTTNALRSNGIHTIRQLVGLTPQQLLWLRGVGRKGVAEIARAIEPHRLQLQLDQRSQTPVDGDRSAGQEVDSFVDAVLEARAHGWTTLSDVVDASRDALLGSGLPTDALDTIAGGLRQWGLECQSGGEHNGIAREISDQDDEPIKSAPLTITGNTVRDQIESAARTLLSEPPARASWAPCLLASVGITGAKPKTLQALADEGEAYGFGHSVSRERVRQVVQKATDYLRSKSARVRLESWDEVVQDMGHRVPIAASTFVARFGFDGTCSTKDKYRVIERCAEWFNVRWPFSILDSRVFGCLVVPIQFKEDWAVKCSHIPTKASGAYVSVESASDDMNCDTEDLRRLMDSSPRWERLDDAGLFYWRRPVLPPRDLAKVRNPLLGALLRVFSVVRRAWIPELALAVARARNLRKHEDGIPELPPAVIEAVARQSGLFDVRDGEIIRKTDRTWCTINREDLLMLRIFEERGPTVTSTEIYTNLLKAGQSQGRASVIVAYSPFVVHVRSGVGTRQGYYKSLAKPEDIKSAGLGAAENFDKITKPADDDGIRIPIDARVRLTGKYATSSPTRLEGIWDVRDSKGRRIGRVEVTANEVVGLSPVLGALRIHQQAVLSLSRDGDDLLAAQVA